MGVYESRSKCSTDLPGLPSRSSWPVPSWAPARGPTLETAGCSSSGRPRASGATRGTSRELSELLVARRVFARFLGCLKGSEKGGPGGRPSQRPSGLGKSSLQVSGNPEKKILYLLVTCCSCSLGIAPATYIRYCSSCCFFNKTLSLSIYIYQSNNNRHFTRKQVVQVTGMHPIMGSPSRLVLTHLSTYTINNHGEYLQGT